MSDRERPQLHPRIYEQVEQLMYRLDSMYWKELAEMQVPVMRSSAEPDPPRLPVMLQGLIEQYANALFRIEGEQYEQFATTPFLMAWLSLLAERVQKRVIAAFDRVEESGKPERSFEYHGLDREKMVSELRTSLWHAGNRIAQDFAERATAKVQPPPGRTPAEVTTQQPLSRRELAQAYKEQFPGALWADVAWAAHQTYREWKRWVNGEAKEGYKADLAFRRVLTSGKSPSELRPEPRPKTRK